ncbi:hypothetical protein ADICYQ_4369 [Cyclobacterium qasimii M12-11B]|uniref:Uncharacterized protein n=1 Tax=Cyclobacterium qasimii M12-11B TaxID=641524 RepID=S7VAM7_9BACT|nr:hypothetical protein ADICYQ_4369 [Cyclobacterium qasimii M12-11B]
MGWPFHNLMLNLLLIFINKYKSINFGCLNITQIYIGIDSIAMFDLINYKDFLPYP